MSAAPDLPYLAAALAGDVGDAVAGGSDLADELGALDLPGAALARLLETGVERRLLAQLCGAGDVAVAMVSLHRGGTFEFGGPDRRLILAVREDGRLIDLLALSSSCEDEWAQRRDAADFLGGELLARAAIEEWRELRIYPTPMAWLRGGGRGVCVLDWSPAAVGALRGLGERCTLVVDPGARERMKAMLAYGGLPLVAEDRPNLGRAA